MESRSNPEEDVALSVFGNFQLFMHTAQLDLYTMSNVLLDKRRESRGVARGGHGWMSPRHGLKKNFSPWITDRWRLCNWCHTPDVAKTKGKCAISTLIFRKFSGPPYWGGVWHPSPDPTPLVLQRFAPPHLARDLRSLHCRVPPYKNPGYFTHNETTIVYTHG